jgi:hypothetical protein
MSWSERVIAAHERSISKSRDRRALLLQSWRQFCEDRIPDSALDLACQLVSGNANEVELGFHVLNALCLTDTTLQCHLIALTTHRSAKVRGSLAFYLTNEFSRELEDTIFRRLLHDKVASVRVQAIGAIGGRAANWLLSDLTALRSTETNHKVLRSLDFWIPLLRNGYRVEPSPDHTHLTVTVLTGRGTSSKILNSTDPNDPRIQRLVEELRERWDERPPIKA